MKLHLDLDSLECLPVPLESRRTIKSRGDVQIEACLFDGQPAALVAHVNFERREGPVTATAERRYTLLVFDSATDRSKWLTSCVRG